MRSAAWGLVVVDGIAFDASFNNVGERQMKNLGGIVGGQILAYLADSAAGVIERIRVIMKRCDPYCGQQ